MSERERKKKPAVQALNFKELYNKKYGDIVTIGKRHSYTPEQVFELAIKYFEWAEREHLEAAETTSFQGVVSEHKVHKPRVFTLNGLRLFCGFSEAVLSKWRKEDGFSDVMEFIDGVIYEQKFQLAANGVIHAGFIGKEIGVDKPTSVAVETNVNTSIDAVNAEEVKEAVRDILDMI